MGERETFCREVQKLREQIEDMNKQIQIARQNYDLEKGFRIAVWRAAEITAAAGNRRSAIQRNDRSLVHEVVTDDEIARIISRWTGIPVARLTEGERAKLLHLEDELHKRVIGQDEGVRRVTDAILRSKGWNQRSDQTNRFFPVPWTYRCW